MQTIASQLDERAHAVLGGGASSPVRVGRRVGGMPFYQSRGEGAHAYDAEGRAYIDYVMGYGPLLFGYRTPGRDSLIAALDQGALFGSTCEAEIRLAERIRTHLPSLERIRFATTGTEAVMGMVRLARAFTGRPLVVRFAGNYHGHSDMALLDAGASAETAEAQRSGIPSHTAEDIRVLTYNDLAGLKSFLQREGDQVALVLLEPIVGNMGLVEAIPGFLEGVKCAARTVGALMAFDEVITWLRLGLQGAQGHVQIKPDLTSFGKILGGGIPIAGFGGREDIMALLAPNGPVFTGGTHAGNPLSVAAAHAVLDELEQQPERFSYMEALAKQLADGLRDIFRKLELPYTVLQLESIVDFKFRAGDRVKNYREASEANSQLYARYYHEMRNRGILLAPSQNEVMFVSTEHTEADIKATLHAARASLETFTH
jgi:glutamate-1-semialdehyde 2,1-aminomutase